MGLLGSHLVSLVPNGPNGEGKQDRVPLMFEYPGQELAETREAPLVPKALDIIHSPNSVQLFAAPHRMHHVFIFFLAAITTLLCNNCSSQ